RKGQKNDQMKLVKTTTTALFFSLALAGCDVEPQFVTAPVSKSTEPFQIKTNDTLGIRLGMSWNDFVKAHHRTSMDCHTKDERDRSCTLFLTDIKIGEERASLATVYFYQDQLIKIDYFLTLSPGGEYVLIKAFEDKFGSLTHSTSCEHWCEW